MPGKFINGNSGNTRKKMNKNKENKREITNFLGHYHRPSTEVYMYDQLG